MLSLKRPDKIGEVLTFKVRGVFSSETPSKAWGSLAKMRWIILARRRDSHENMVKLECTRHLCASPNDPDPGLLNLILLKMAIYPVYSL